MGIHSPHLDNFQITATRKKDKRKSIICSVLNKKWIKSLFPYLVRLRWHHKCQWHRAWLLTSVCLLLPVVAFSLFSFPPYLINRRNECCHPLWCFNYPWLVCNKVCVRDPFNQASHGKRPPGCLAELSSVAPRRGTCPLRFTSTCLIHLNHPPLPPLPPNCQWGSLLLLWMDGTSSDFQEFLFGHLKASLSTRIKMGVYLKQLGWVLAQNPAHRWTSTTAI